jgi:glutathione S-transferase
MYEFELISHPLCPFNQRLVATLLLKGLKIDRDFVVNYVDLANIPDWFKEISPHGEMPVLKLNKAETLFKTNPINEFLNETTAGNLHSDDAIEKARDRYWIEYSDKILNLLKDVFTANNIESFKQNINQLFELFGPVENHLDLKSKYWRNQHYTLVDGAFMPAFSLMFNFNFFKNHSYWQNYPKTFHWANNLMETSFAVESQCPDYNDEFNHFFALTKSSFKKFIKSSLQCDLVTKS